MYQNYEEWQSYIHAFFNWKILVRIVIGSLIGHFLALGLGIPFLLIFFGLWHMAIRLAIYWEPAYLFFMKLCRVSDPPPKPKLKPRAWISVFVILIIHGIVSFALVGLGFSLIVKYGICYASFVCAIFGVR
jgi:hypothetical protein